MRDFVKTREIFTLEGMDEGKYTERVVICVPEFAWLKARSLLSHYGSFDSQYATAYYAGGYDSPDALTMDKIDNSIGHFLGALDMSCDIVAALEALVDCCKEGNQGAFGAGKNQPSAASFIDNGLDFPVGFEDRSAYSLAKCATANTIVGSLKSDMEWLISVDFVDVALTVFTGSLLTPIPADDVATGYALVLGYFAQGLLDTYAQEVVDLVDAHGQTMVCTFYSGETVGDGQVYMFSLFESELSLPAQALAKAWSGYSAYNGLYEKNIQLISSNQTVNVDCALCGDNYLQYGVRVGNSAYESEYTGASHTVSIAFLAETWTTAVDPLPISVEIVSMPGFTPMVDTTEPYRQRSDMGTGGYCDGWDVYCGDVMPVGFKTVKKMSLRSSTAFTVVFKEA